MTRLPRLLRRVLLFVALLDGLSGAAQPSPAPLLLVSLDGFRWDYVAKHPNETPHLQSLMRTGVSAKAMIPVFPSLTFANHYTLVTGLYPAHHGIIANNFFDPTLGAVFNYKLAASVRDARWWGGEPIWVTAVKQGRNSASQIWVGSEAAVGGVRPTFFRTFADMIPYEKRLEEIMAWLHLPADRRPAVITIYFEDTNSAGHSYGPGSPEVTAAIKRLDAQVGGIAERARADGIPINLIVVSDHGMADTDGQTKTTLLDDYVDLAKVQVDFDGVIGGLRPLDNDVDGLVARLAKLPAPYHVYRARELPARWHLTDNPRMPDVWVVPDEGWRIQTRARLIATRDARLKGEHGYDNAIESMGAIFIANGPAFKNDGSVIQPFENIHLYNLLCAVIGLKPAPNDGDDRLAKSVLKD